MLRQTIRVISKNLQKSSQRNQIFINSQKNISKNLKNGILRNFSMETETQKVQKAERLKFLDFPRGSEREIFNPNIGDLIGSFEVIKKDYIKDFGCTMFLMKHKELGTHWFHFDSPTINNSMSLIFRTLPDDSTGKPHILEHTGLIFFKIQK